MVATATGLTILLEPEPAAAMAMLAGAGGRSTAGLTIIASSDPGQLTALHEGLRGCGARIMFYHGGPADLRRDLPIRAALVLAPDRLAGHRSVASWRASGATLAIYEDGRVEPPVSSNRGGTPAYDPPEDLLDAVATALADRYWGEGALSPTGHTPVADITLPIRRRAARTIGRGAAGSGPWPYAPGAGLPLPATLPDGRPWPRISIVVPTLNQGAFIEECLLSVLNQGYPDLELIVMDGGSTDGTMDIVHGYADRLTWFESGADAGQADAINKGMARATGEILTWLNSDDMLAPGALAAGALALSEPDVDLVAGVCEIWRDGRLVRQHLTLCPDGPLPLDRILDLDGGWNAGTFFYQPEVLFSRAAWTRAGGRVDPTLHYSMDWDLWVRFAETGARLKVIGRPIARFRLHADQKTHEPAGYRDELRRIRDAYLARTGHVPRVAEPDRVRESLRIVFLNDVGIAGGAGIAHGRLAEALALGGHQIVPIAFTETPVDTRGDWPAPQSAVIDAVAAARPDLVVVGNLHAARPHPSILDALAQRWPTLFVLHDFWLLTGRCPYPQTCGGAKFLHGCDADCPNPSENPPLAPERIAEAWAAKRRVLSADRPPVLLVNSDWSAGVVAEALAATGPRDGGGVTVARIGLGLPTERFRPQDRGTARRVLGLPEDSFLIFLTVTDVAETRKGVDDLLAALEQLDVPDVAVVAVGRGRPPEAIGGRRIHHLGYITDPDRLALIYAAVDLLVSPSAVETLGQVFIEAAACGTPSLGYRVSGMAEAVREGTSGLLTAPSAHELAAAMVDLYGAERYRRDLGAWGRIWAESRWSLSASARSFHLMLEGTGLAQALGLAPHLTLLPAVQPLPDVVHILPALTPWMPRANFGDLEGPYPDLGLPELRWARGPRADFDVQAETDGPHLLVIFAHNGIAGQVVELVQGDAVLARFELPLADPRKRHALRAIVDLRRGHTRLALRFERWLPDRNADALMVSGMRAISKALDMLPA